MGGTIPIWKSLCNPCGGLGTAALVPIIGTHENNLLTRVKTLIRLASQTKGSQRTFYA